MSIQTPEEFNQVIQHFESITADQAAQRLESQPGTIVFIGRGTCPFCRKFVATLQEFQSETHANIAFLNSEDVEQAESVQKLRDTYDVKTVPGFLYRDNEGVTVRCDSSLTVSDLKEITQN